jgi:hypothetical protein
MGDGQLTAIVVENATMIGSRVTWIVMLIALTPAWVPAGARAALEKPEDVLQSHGLKKSGSTYVVASEADVLKKVNEARLASRQLNRKLRRLSRRPVRHAPPRK